MKALLLELSDVADCYMLGIVLGLKHSQVKQIQASLPTATVDQWKGEILDLWLRTSKKRSWKVIVDALCAMNQHVLSDRIQQKYCKQRRGKIMHSLVLAN